nr:reverse transcriptase domain-containing protein [Tanacetum cinerariifolium]
NMIITHSGMTLEAIEELVNRRVKEALAAYEATRARELMKLMAEVYCPRNEIQKMESELWNLTMKNNDLAAYTQRFQELTMLCTKMVPEEEDWVEKFIGGLPGYAVKKAENKRRLEVNQRDNHGQEPPFKRPNAGGKNMVRAYTAGNNERKPYNRPLPFCNKCKLRHEGPCTVRCGKCNKIGHLTQDSNHHAVIVCDEKIVRIPYGDEVLIVHGDRGGKGEKSKLSIISCIKIQKYIKRGCLIFMAQVTKKETKDKSEEKRLEVVPTVQDFPEVFPEDFHGLPSTKQV